MKKFSLAILVTLIVGVGFAFVPKESNYCFYKKSGNTCPLNACVESYTIISPTGGDEYITGKNPEGNCPASVNVSLCIQQIDVVID